MIPQIPISNSLALPSFFALGDSYSAGIGANCGWILDEFDTTGVCLRCNGSYSHQVANLTGPEVEVYHTACTGATIHDILHIGPNNRTSQIDMMKSKSGMGKWGTLSIGGNDVGFGAVVANCIAYNRASCDADLNSTEDSISDPHFVSQLAETYLAVLEASSPPNFRLIVPGYAQFFNAATKECDGQYLWFGRYLTQELRARVNKMVANLNVVIQIAVAIVQMRLVFSNSRKGIHYEDWDGLFEGHRFCEEKPKGWVDAWFFTIQGADTLPNETAAAVSDLEMKGREIGRLKTLKCDGEAKEDLGEQMACNEALEKGLEKGGNITINVYPWWAMKTMHPKTIAHYELGKRIHQKWVHGEYS